MNIYYMHIQAGRFKMSPGRINITPWRAMYARLFDLTKSEHRLAEMSVKNPMYAKGRAKGGFKESRGPRRSESNNESQCVNAINIINAAQCIAHTARIPKSQSK